MFGSGIVDLVLGLLFLFLVFSLVVSGVNEAITKAFAWRSRHLWRAIRQLMDGPATDLTKDPRPNVRLAEDAWTDRFAMHPLIRQLEGRLPTVRTRLSHIPSSDFSRAVLDVVVPEGEGATSVEQILARARALPPESPLRAPLLAILAEAGGRVDQVRAGIGEWFDARMAALSKTYKRHTKYVLVVVGLAVAIGFNVDAIGASQRLYRDEALRSAVAEQAATLATGCDGSSDVAECARDQVARVDAALELPVGWTANARDEGVDGLQVLGWLAAAIALGQGAPFWFDLVRRVSRLRR